MLVSLGFTRKKKKKKKLENARFYKVRRRFFSSQEYSVFPEMTFRENDRDAIFSPPPPWNYARYGGFTVDYRESRETTRGAQKHEKAILTGVMSDVCWPHEWGSEMERNPIAGPSRPLRTTLPTRATHWGVDRQAGRLFAFHTSGWVKSEGSYKERNCFLEKHAPFPRQRMYLDFELPSLSYIYNPLEGSFRPRDIRLRQNSWISEWNSERENFPSLRR